jgi:hypothetical protein
MLWELGACNSVVKVACPSLETPFTFRSGNSRPYTTAASYMYCGNPMVRMSKPREIA